MSDYIEADPSVNATDPESLSVLHGPTTEWLLTAGRPTSSVRGVFEDDIQGCEFITDSVGECEVTLSTRRGPTLNQSFDH